MQQNYHISPLVGRAFHLFMGLQVTFHLSADNIFSAEARELDSGRHHLWQNNDGGAMVAGGINAGDLKDGVLQA